MRLMRRLCAAFVVATAVALPAGARAAEPPSPAQTEGAAVRVFLAEPRVSLWLDRYRDANVVTVAERAKSGGWTVRSTVDGVGDVASGRHRCDGGRARGRLSRYGGASRRAGSDRIGSR